MSEPIASAGLAGHRDRRTGLIVFGVLEIVCGALSALMVPLGIFGQVMSARTMGVPTRWGSLAMSLGVYAALAVALVWLGIGSIRLRRWARALSLILGWSWLVVGVIALLIVLLISRGMAGQAGSGAPSVAALGIVLSCVACPMALLPAALVIFYGSRHVKATCEAADPRPGWTDACPLPVLAAALWMAFGACTLLMMAASGQAAVALFGTMLVGIPGALVSLAFVPLWCYLAWALYRLRRIGWWLTLAVFVIFGASSIVSFMRIDLMELYQRMGYPEQQIEALRRMPVLTGANMAVFLAVLFVAMMGYLLWIGRFFFRSGNLRQDGTIEPR